MHVCIDISIYLSKHLSNYLSTHQTVYLSIHLLIHLSIHLSIYIHTYFHTHPFVFRSRAALALRVGGRLYLDVMGAVSANTIALSAASLIHAGKMQATQERFHC